MKVNHELLASSDVSNVVPEIDESLGFGPHFCSVMQYLLVDNCEDVDQLILHWDKIKHLSQMLCFGQIQHGVCATDELFKRIRRPQLYIC